MRRPATADDLKAAGRRAIAIRTDVSSFPSCQEMAERTVESFGQIDVLINNAALFAAILPKKPFDTIPEDEWDQVMAVNVRGSWNANGAVFPYMKERRYGRIVNISSKTVLSGTEGLCHYVRSKAAAIGLTRSIAREIGGYNITSNAVAPGLTASEGAKRGYPAALFEEVARASSLKRQQEPDDLVGVVSFLASDEARFMTGQTLNVDGGNVMY